MNEPSTYAGSDSGQTEKSEESIFSRQGETPSDATSDTEPDTPPSPFEAASILLSMSGGTAHSDIVTSAPQSSMTNREAADALLSLRSGQQLSMGSGRASDA